MEAILELARRNGGLLTRKQIKAEGILVGKLERLARVGAVARVARGVYAVAGAVVAHEPWAVTRAHNVVLSRLSAAAWWGIDMPIRVVLMQVTAPRNRGRRKDAMPGIDLRRAALRHHHITTHRGVRITTPLRTALDIARHEPLEIAVPIVDAFFRARLLSFYEWQQATALAGGPGRLRIQTVASLVDPQSGSILESLVRVLLWRHGFLPTESQYQLEHAPTGWRGRLDFAWPELRVALECDGYEFHTDRAAFQGDRRRWSTLSRMHWTVGVVTWFDVTSDPCYVVELVADLLGRPAPTMASAHKRGA
ncbi:MAG TPA: type IV toxin-antitoxin system AbiEi family antitoxin domain-containing protein [Mycobacteriales bacterium]|nr:type IV toxin-antitoxin system AbiEi family antitoxin domain-containing protein [Mycobacteriales bacterium]